MSYNPPGLSISKYLEQGGNIFEIKLLETGLNEKFMFLTKPRISNLCHRATVLTDDDIIDN